MTNTLFAIVDRFGNSTVGRDRAVSVHRTQEAADKALRRTNSAVRRGHGSNAYSGWVVVEVEHGTKRGDIVS